MKTFKVWFVLALSCACATAWADPPSQVGRLSHVTGTVSFAPADTGNEWVVAPLNRPITTGDRLWADRDGRAELRIGSTAVRLNAQTSVDVLRLDGDATQLRLAQGALNVQLRRLDAGDSFEISTPGGAVLLSQPGNYRVQVDPSGATTVLVRRGEADVLTGNTPLTLRDGEAITLSAQGQDRLAAPPPDEFDNWAAARDRQEERIVATRYVPPEMTGYEELDQHGTWQDTPQYGAVWSPAVVAAGWAPYRDGRWVWISPWGWTWVDSAPWGFAPYHYGRWVWLGHRWAWAPGARVARPVYAPALVAFVGGSNWSVSVGAGPAVGWVPLGWREPYIPWYRHSPTYVRNVNVTHVTNINVIHQYSDTSQAARIRYVNRDIPAAVTVVSRDTFVSARRVHDARLNVPAHALAAARITHDAPVSRPERQSFTAARPGVRLPAAVAAREVVAARAPVAPARLVNDATPGRSRDAVEERPRVRVLDAQQSFSRRGAPDNAARPAPAAEVPAAPAMAPPRVRERVAEPPSPGFPAQARERPIEPVPGAVQQPRQPPARREGPPPAPVQAPAAADAQQQLQAQRERQARDQAQQLRQQQGQQQQAAQQRAQEMQHQRERQARDEQRRQAQMQAQQLQSQKLQEQRERQHQAVQQRAQEVQQQRERQFQQAQQVDQQRQAQRDHRREEREAARQARQPPQAVPPNPQSAPPQQRAARAKAEAERVPVSR